MSKHHHGDGAEAAGEPEQDGAGTESGANPGVPAAEAAGENEAPAGAEALAGNEAAQPLTPEEKIAALEAALAEAKNDYLRKAADFENFRKRMNPETQTAIDFANQSLLLDLIPVIDDFERAIQSAESSEDFASLPTGRALLDGIAMIEKRLTGQLESKWGLKRFDSAGEPFDPNRHEALMMEKSPDISEPVVREDLIKGYMLKDRVIRAAKVKVLMPESPAQADKDGEK
jgi:molecular chaperone GrpE